MPKRTDIETILILGAGPIVIGQACEFDYSGTQACKALREEGYRVVLVNSNPATIMTDPELADRTYIEPLIPEAVERIIERERPQAVLPTVGGQTALNLALALEQRGSLAKLGVEHIGAKIEAIRTAENRERFAAAMREIGLSVPTGGFVKSMAEAEALLARLEMPVIIRPSFTLGGHGGGTAYNRAEYQERIRAALAASPIGEALVETCLRHWKEFELEVVRDLADNCIIVCSIENIDPMGVHTGDSVTVAPALTLTDREYQAMRDDAFACIRRIGVETGGSNVQFAVNPATGERLIIEMNPRVSRSSALASKATGFPIARVAAKLSVGLTLDEIPNEITGKTLASFEPAIDYVVVKFPRWDFDKFRATPPVLGVQMRSVGEVMALGRTFNEAIQKAARSLENGRDGLGADGGDPTDKAAILESLRTPTPSTMFHCVQALRLGATVAEVHEITGIDPWFLDQFEELVRFEAELKAPARTIDDLPEGDLRAAKRLGYSDEQLAWLLGSWPEDVSRRRHALGIVPAYKQVDTCAAEFEATTAYYYSTYERETESVRSDRKKVVILGSGPNRIGQGIEFDYCCVQAAIAAREAGWETILVNCNPETVSTDYDTTDKLYFEPITEEDVLHILELERPNGVLVQFGGQAPLKISRAIEAAGFPILGTSPESIDIAEDRERFGALIERLGIPHPEDGVATSVDQALAVARRIGYPVLVRPSYVLGGRAMEIVYDDESLAGYIARAAAVSPKHPVLIDSFLEDAFEFDVDALCDGKDVVLAGVMQHIEEAGIHSGDSSCVLPPYRISSACLETLCEYTKTLARELEVVGLMNVQFAMKDEVVYVLEVNPRASRTAPFVSKAKGIQLARLATQLCLGATIASLGLPEVIPTRNVAVKKPVFPFARFPGSTVYLGPEMKSTGEVMGIAASFGNAFAKAMLGDSWTPPTSGLVVISVNDNDKLNAVAIARDFAELGFPIGATAGTARTLHDNGIAVKRLFKVKEGRPDLVDAIVNGDVAIIVNTPMGARSRYDEYAIGAAALQYKVLHITTLSGAQAAVRAIRNLRSERLEVCSLQEFNERSLLEG